MCALMTGNRLLIWKLLEAGADTLVVTRVPPLLLLLLLLLALIHIAGGENRLRLRDGISDDVGLPRLPCESFTLPLLLR